MQWPTGQAPFGHGAGDENTTTARTQRATHYRHLLDIDPAVIAAHDFIEVALTADDAAQVWINGALVVHTRTSRTAGSYAVADSLAYGSTERDEQRYLVPTEVLRPGPNIVTARLLPGWSNDPETHLAIQITVVERQRGGPLPGWPDLRVRRATNDPNQAAVSFTPAPGTLGHLIRRNGWPIEWRTTTDPVVNQWVWIGDSNPWISVIAYSPTGERRNSAQRPDS